jgi:hypothetical protein
VTSRDVFRDSHHLQADQLEATRLEPPKNLADQPSLDPVGLDQHQRTLWRHGY